jgi:hypothetical protein
LGSGPRKKFWRYKGRKMVNTTAAIKKTHSFKVTGAAHNLAAPVKPAAVWGVDHYLFPLEERKHGVMVIAGWQNNPAAPYLVVQGGSRRKTGGAVTSGAHRDVLPETGNRSARCIKIKPLNGTPKKR